MILKFWAFIYRTTGYFSNYARKKESEYIKTIMPLIEMRYVGEDFSLETKISIETGLWQAQNGFYKSSKHLKRSMNKTLKRIKKKYKK